MFLESVGYERSGETGQKQNLLPDYLRRHLEKNFPNALDSREPALDDVAQAKQSPGKPLYDGTVQGGAREVYDRSVKPNPGGVNSRFEGQPPTGNADIDNIYDYTGDV